MKPRSLDVSHGRQHISWTLMRPNWFIALPVADDGWFDARVPAPPDGIRRFVAADLHATVAFLGPVTEDVARGTFEALGGLPAPGPLAARLGAVVPMGNPRRYSALSALLTDGREAVEAAMASWRDPLLARAGASPETRPVKAHITVARPMRRATDRERGAALSWAETLDLADVKVRLDRIGLYTWSHDRKARLFAIDRARDL